MKKHKPMRVLLAAITAVLLLAAPLPVDAQGRGQPQVRATGRPGALVDLPGYWVSLVTDDWRYRMGLAKKGDNAILPLNDLGRRTANAWDPMADEAAGLECKPYGAAAVMRQPGRLHVTWEDDTTLRIDTDAGTQTRRFHFGPQPPPQGELTWQGHSLAEWVRPRVGKGGQLKVVTTNMRSGYYFKHGPPYSDDAVMTEYFVSVTEPNGDLYLLLTAIVEDPRYLNQEFVRTLQFKKEPDGSRWKPRPCSIR